MSSDRLTQFNTRRRRVDRRWRRVACIQWYSKQCSLALVPVSSCVALYATCTESLPAPLEYPRRTGTHVVPVEQTFISFCCLLYYTPLHAASDIFRFLHLHTTDAPYDLHN
jgi:hypothetical protein